MARLGWAHRFDHLQALLTAMLLALGLMTVYSASVSEFRRQLVWLALGLGAYLAAAFFDYRRLREAAIGCYAACVLLLLAVHVVGHASLGARRWLSVAGVPVEPSEFAKLLMLLVLAAYFTTRERLSWRDVFGACLLSAPPAGLILLQPDLGTTIVFVSLLLGMLYLAGAGRLHLVALVAMLLAVVPIAPHLLRGYQRQRLEIFLNPSRDPLGAGYNLIQARLAVGSGGVFGQGWLHGAQGSLGYVPERTTDFVFAVYAEQFGLAGCLLLLTLFGLLVFRLARGCAGARDRYGHLLLAGVATLLFAQVVQNVGMNVGLTPIAGIPLPLISYGGSAMVVDLALLGLAQSVMVRRRLVAHGDRRPSPEHLLTESGTVRLPV